MEELEKDDESIEIDDGNIFVYLFAGVKYRVVEKM